MGTKAAILSVKILGDAKGAGKAAHEAEGIFGKMGTKIKGALGFAAISAGALAVGKALYSIGETFDEVEDTIRVGTGATGDALAGLADDAKAVATSIPTSFEAAGSTVADLNTRLGLTGPTLQTVASQYLEAGRILGETVDIETTSAAFSAFKIEGDAVTGAMDDLFRVSQATGVGINKLAGSVSKNAPAMQELGFTFQDTASLVGILDKAGLDADKTLTSMNRGLMQLAKSGEEPAAAFKRVSGELTGMLDAGDRAGALDMAGKLFGTKGASQFIAALESGTLAAGDLMNAAGATSDTILGVGEETQDAAEKWQILKNKGLEALEPLGSAVFGFAGDALGAIMDFVNSADFEPIKNAVTGIFDKLGEIGNQIMPTITGVFETIKTAAQPYMPQIQAFMTTVGDIIGSALEVIGGIIGVTLSAIQIVWQNFGGPIIGIVTTVFNALAGIIGPALNTVKAVISTVLAVIRGDWSGAWNGLIGIVSGIWSTIKGIVSGAIGIIGGVIRGAAGMLWNAASMMMQGLINGIKNAAGAVWNAIKGVVGGAIDKIKNFLGIHSPSRVFAGIGAQTGAGFVQGILAGRDDVSKAGVALASASIPAPVAFPTPAYSFPQGTQPAPITININGGFVDRTTLDRLVEALDARARAKGLIALNQVRYA